MTFNTVAPLYDEMRPGYPDELVEDVLALSGIPPLGKILEIGCGTGQATRSFAGRGYEMLCLDIGADLIGVARAQLRDYANVAFQVCSFEDWRSDRCPDLIISATAFHWVDPMVSYAKAAEVLAGNGALSVFSNTHIRKDEGFFADVQEVYREHVPEWCQKSENVEESSGLVEPTTEPGLEFFDEPIRRKYAWSRYYTAEEYVNLLGTYSGHIALPDQKRGALLDGIRDFINRCYDGRILKHYESVADVRKTKN